MLENKRITFLGAGSMAEAIISGMIKSRKIKSTQITVTNQSNLNRLEFLKSEYGINIIPKEKLSIGDEQFIVLAMKPKDAEKSLHSIRHLVQPHTIVVSLIAGISTRNIEQQLPLFQPVIRIMPNTSSMIRESATGITSGKYASLQSLKLVRELFESIGKVYEIDEKHLDLFTAVAGSGPAYFYYLMEHIEKVVIQSGLPENQTRQIIAQTLVGAAKMVQEKGESPTVLREKVTSPNGTTAAGLQALVSNGGDVAITEAIKKATERSNEIRLQLQKSIV